jgi:Ras-related C3 botulinum toxin substrate 1
MQPLKLVVIGDGAVGKTSLLVSYTTNSFPIDYTPTIFDNYYTCVVIDKATISLELWDTAGQEAYDTLRPLSYALTDVFLACYSVVSPTSYINTREKWIHEVRHHCPNAPVVIVGLKTDLRNDPNVISQLAARNEQALTEDDGHQLVKHVAAQCYMECSALSLQGVSEVFVESIRLVLKNHPGLVKRKCKKSCNLL